MGSARVLIGACLGLSGLGFASFAKPDAKLIWNRTASAPTGLYWLTDGPLTRNDWVVLSARSEPAEWAAERGYVGKDWPILKRIIGMDGDEICRTGQQVWLNGEAIAEALDRDSSGRAMPEWSGCFTLATGEYFLLNEHSGSLDGRYSGPVDDADIVGSAMPVWVK